MYYPYLITYMLAGFIISVVTFIWALKNGQFKDQQRARYLPLADVENGPPLRAPRYYRIKIFLLFAMACAGIVSTAAVIGYVVLSAV